MNCFFMLELFVLKVVTRFEVNGRLLLVPMLPSSIIKLNLTKVYSQMLSVVSFCVVSLYLS